MSQEDKNNTGTENSVKSGNAGCDGCQGECHCGVHCNGDEIANAAISEMAKAIEKDDAERKSTLDLDAQADEFLKACSAKGKDPVLVVKHIANRDGIDLSEEEEDLPDESNSKSVTKALLLAVLRKFILDTASFVIQEMGNSADWKEIIKNYINDRFGKVGKSADGSEVESRGDTVATVEPHMLNTAAAVKVLKRVESFLSMLCRDGRCDDHCSACLGASDLADDVWDVLHPTMQGHYPCPEPSNKPKVFVRLPKSFRCLIRYYA